MIQVSFFVNKQRKRSKWRWSKSCIVAVVDNGDGMDITNVTEKSRVYDTNVGPNKEKRQKITRIH